MMLQNFQKMMWLATFFIPLAFCGKNWIDAMGDFGNSVMDEFDSVMEDLGIKDKENPSVKNAIKDQNTTRAPQFWSAKVGDVCQYSEEFIPYPAGISDGYLECVQPTKDEAEWPWVDKGLWVLQNCTPGTFFYPSARACKSSKSIRHRDRSIRKQCSTTGENCYPSQQFVVSISLPQPTDCQCPQYTQNCVCPTTQIIQPQPYQPVVQPNQSGCPCQAGQINCQCPVLPAQPYQPVVQPIQTCQCPSQSSNCQCPQQPYVQPQQPYVQPQQPYVQPQQPYVQPQQPYVQPQQPNVQPQQPYVQPQQPYVQPQQPYVQPQVQTCMCPSTSCYQQSQCPTMRTTQCPCQQQVIQQPQGCQGASNGYTNAAQGQPCSWQLAPLAPLQGNSQSYLQCVPQPRSDNCGAWMVKPCAPGTQFDVTVQVCVRPQGTGSTGSCCNSGPSIGTCNAQSSCPGQQTCQISCNSCCSGSSSYNNGGYNNNYNSYGSSYYGK